jgi:uncharacterized membrane protein
MAILRVVHIVCGAFIVGVALFNALFFLPAVRDAGPGAGGPVMMQLMKRKFPVWITSALTLVFLTGIVMLRAISGGSGAWFQSRFAHGLTAGALFTVIAAVIGQGVNGRTGKRIGRLMAGGPPSPEVQAEVAKLQARLLLGTRAVAVFMVLAAASMAVARYL